MSGYKRVSFYELCRLCASNTQKEKTHIFQEEGRKIQLQNKIQTCLAVTVNENDFLPKVVCSKCLRILETCFGFRQECVRSESMLSTYFKNYRYTEDFKKTGKVYIKDIKPTTPVIALPALHQATQQNPEISTSTNLTAMPTISVAQSVPPNIVGSNRNQQQADPLPYYTLQLPTIVSNPNSLVKTTRKEAVDNKLNHVSQNHQLTYNLNVVNAAALKTNLPKNEMLSNVVVNSNGEVINIAHMGDFETILNQGNVVRTKQKTNRRSREHKLRNAAQDDDVVKIDLTDQDNILPIYDLEQNNDRLPHIKSTQSQNKYSYSVKMDDKNQNQTVILPLSQYNQNLNNYGANNAIYTQSNLNLVNSTNSITSNANVVCNAAANVDSSTLNMNVLDQNLQDMGQTGYTNVISNMPSAVLNSSTNESDVKLSATDGSDIASSSTNPPTKTHICEVCSRSFKRREHLIQHVKLHTGFRPYFCVNCNKTFMRKEHLIRHSTLHSGQKNYTCNVCDKSFSRNDNLLKHKKTHEKQNSYTCEICQKQFVMKHYYNAHKLTHGDKCYVSAAWGFLKT